MKSCLFLLLYFLLLTQGTTQSRYLDEVFPEVTVTLDVVYGRNISFLFNSVLGPVSINLEMDVYEPIGDTLLERPLVLVFHDGNFLPPVSNGEITGARSDSSVVEICTRLAQRGFTAAAVSYRIGWNPIASTHDELVYGLIQAIYRGVQDGRTAIRYFRKNHAEMGNAFHIDPDRIVAWGNGTGALISLNMMALSDINEISMTTHSPGKFLFDNVVDSLVGTPMIREEFIGDIEGKNLMIAPYTNWVFSAGDTTNHENHPNYSSDFHLAVNVGGAVADISWLADNTIPSISVQSNMDTDYPYGDYVLVVHPGTPIFAMQGSRLIGELQNELGHNQAWKDGINLEEPFTQQAMIHSDLAGHAYFDGVYPVVTTHNSNGVVEGVVIDWWDPNTPSPTDNMIPWNELEHWSGLSFHEYALLSNENMSAEKARANIDTILHYFAPRACITLELDDCQSNIFTSTSATPTSEMSVRVYPNPSCGLVTIDAHQPIRTIEVLDLNAKLLQIRLPQNLLQTTLNLSSFPKGIYLVKIQTSEAVSIQRILLN